MTLHTMICLFKSNCNSVSNRVCKNLHVIVLFGFFSFISTMIPSAYTNNIFPSMFTDEVSDEQI